MAPGISCPLLGRQHQPPWDMCPHSSEMQGSEDKSPLCLPQVPCPADSKRSDSPHPSRPLPPSKKEALPEQAKEGPLHFAGSELRQLRDSFHFCCSGLRTGPLDQRNTTWPGFSLTMSWGHQLKAFNLRAGQDLQMS